MDAELSAFRIQTEINLQDVGGILVNAAFTGDRSVIHESATNAPDQQMRKVLRNSAVHYAGARSSHSRVLEEVTLRMTSQDQPAGRRPSKLAAALQNVATWVHSVLYRS